MELLSVGEVFGGRYRVTECAVRGVSSELYLATDTATGRQCVIKALTPAALDADDGRQRFVQQMRVTASLDCPYLVQIIAADVDAQTGVPFVAMELLRGADLASIVQQSGAVPPEQVAGWLGQLALALDEIHRADVAHGRVEPSHLYLARDEAGAPCIKLLGAGTASLTAAGLGSETVGLGGELRYLAPEQLAGEPPSPATDLYAFGQIAFTLLIGEPYWPQPSVDGEGRRVLIEQMRAGPIAKPSERAGAGSAKVTGGFDRWFAVATAADPSERFANAGDQLESLKLALGVRSSSDGRLHRVLDKADDADLGSTLPDDGSLDDGPSPAPAVVSSEGAHPPIAPSTQSVPSSGGEEVDPLGDTCAGAGPQGETLAVAAQIARAEAQAMRSAPAPDRRPPPMSQAKVAGRRVAITIAIAVFALAATALIAAFAF